MFPGKTSNTLPIFLTLPFFLFCSRVSVTSVAVTTHVHIDDVMDMLMRMFYIRL